MKGNSSEVLAGETGERRREENTTSGLRQLKISQAKPGINRAVCRARQQQGGTQLLHSAVLGDMVQDEGRW